MIDGKVMIAQRNYGSSQGFFEFPGGKVEGNETKEEALIRDGKKNVILIFMMLDIYHQVLIIKMDMKFT